MAKVLTKWNVSTFGNIHAKKRKLTARMEGIQRCLCNQPNHRLLKLHIKLKKDLETVLEQEELLWFQKSTEDWIVLGDRNTKFYHASTMVKRGKNKITALLKDSGEWVLRLMT